MRIARHLATYITILGLFLGCLSATLGCGATETPERNSNIGDTELSPTTGTDLGSSNEDTSEPEPISESPTVVIVTSMGEITVELNTEKAPITTTNFLTYVDDGFYDGDDGLGATTFHRIISGFMVQGGGITSDGNKKLTRPAIVNESTNGLLNLRGTLAMARTNDPDSATSQFFINHVDNDFLDYADASSPGYAVFGEVLSGMDVVDAIAAVKTDAGDAPLETVTLVDVHR